MSKTFLITMDGPAASGKTSVSRELSKRLGWKWASTGAFYRGLAYVALQEKVHLENEGELCRLMQNPKWEVHMAPDRTHFLYKGQDVTDQIYLEEIASAASIISSFPKFRAGLLQAQRNLYTGEMSLLVEGRDCGTVVFPQADLKFYLTANQKNRAERRAEEQGRNWKEVQAAQAQRDYQDENRAVAPMQVPENAIVVDTSQMDLQQVVEHIHGVLRRELPL